MSAVVELGPAQGCVAYDTPAGERIASFELVGPSDGPLLLVHGGISADAHVCASAADPRPGWWDALVGEGRAIDTRRVRVLSLDWQAGARSLDEQVAATAAVLDALAIERCAALGASLGGSLALALAAALPERVHAVGAIAAAHRPHARAVLWRALQREALALGRACGDEAAGLRVARGLALSTYAGAAGLERGFAGRAHAIAEWAARHAEAWTRGSAAVHWSARAALLDSVEVAPALVRARALLVAFEGDELVPPALFDELARGLGGPVERCAIATEFGHDAFLRDVPRFGPRVARWCTEVLR